MSAFYAAVLDLALPGSDGDHVILDSPGIQLVIHAIPASIAEAVVIASPPDRREDSAVKLVLPVASIARVRAAAAALGGQIDAPEREWRFQNNQVCDGHDPEGNVLQVRQRPL